jgi:enoyl-CoA hydratase/carnithine racemase
MDVPLMGSTDLVLTRCEPIPSSEGKALVISLHRPDQLNAMSWEMVKAFDAAVSQGVADESVRVIFVTGVGRAFSAGGDLEMYRDLQRDPVRFPQFVADLHAAFSRLRTLRVPVIALVNGVTAAGGLELLLSCDVALAANSSTIGDAHLNFGQMGGGGVLTLLPRMVGIQRATELVLSGKFLTSSEALEWGLVSRVVPDDTLLHQGMELAAEIAGKSPLAVANAKYVMNAVWAEAMSVSAGLRLELERNVLYCLTSEDAPEGLLAFSEKRTPRFSGR